MRKRKLSCFCCFANISTAAAAAVGTNYVANYVVVVMHVCALQVNTRLEVRRYLLVAVDRLPVPRFGEEPGRRDRFVLFEYRVL